MKSVKTYAIAGAFGVAVAISAMPAETPSDHEGARAASRRAGLTAGARPARPR